MPGFGAQQILNLMGIGFVGNNSFGLLFSWIHNREASPCLSPIAPVWLKPMAI